jgi:hypothetical protein
MNSACGVYGLRQLGIAFALLEGFVDFRGLKHSAVTLVERPRHLTGRMAEGSGDENRLDSRLGGYDGDRFGCGCVWPAIDSAASNRLRAGSAWRNVRQPRDGYGRTSGWSHEWPERDDGGDRRSAE